VPDASKHVLAHVFKVVVDPFVGRLGIFRVYQGTINKDTQLFVGDGRKAFKVGHLFMLQGAKYVEVDQVVPGDLAAVAKVEEIEFDRVLHDSHDEDHIHMRPLEFPVPMHGFAITPKRRGDDDGFIASTKFIQEHPEAVKDVLRAQFAATDYIKSNPQDAYKQMAEFAKVDEAAVRYSFEKNLIGVASSYVPDVEGIAQTEAVAQELGFAPAGVNLPTYTHKFVNTALAKEALAKR
jgi:hypothetical protein